MKIKQILFLLAFVVFMLSGCTNKTQNSTKQSIFAMDTYMSIEAFGENSEVAVKEAANEINRLDELLSTGKETSEITKLNKNNGGNLSDDVSYLIEESLKINKETNGAFDITIYPVMRAWGFTDQNFRVPASEELDKLLLNVDSSRLVYDKNNSSIEFPEGFEIDLGGIAKGYTGENVARILKNNGINSAMINLGGNIQVIGKKTDGSDWKIGIEDPKKQGNYLGAISVCDKAVVTSGGYERYFEEGGITYHHIIDPKTGYPAYNGIVSVSIICEDGTLADALSTSLFIMGTDNAVTFWRKHTDEFDFVLYTDEGKLLVTEGLKEKFTSNYKYTIVNRQD